MVLFTLLRGFQVPIAALDTFLRANHVDESLAITPIKSDGPIDQLLRAKSGGQKTRLIVAYRKSYNRPSFGYIAFDWLHVFSQREIRPSDISETPPSGFSALQDEILAFAKEDDGKDGDNGAVTDGDSDLTTLYAVITDERVYTPLELQERGQVLLHSFTATNSSSSF
jgi:hypothetical protein